MQSTESTGIHSWRGSGLLLPMRSAAASPGPAVIARRLGDSGSWATMIGTVLSAARSSVAQHIIVDERHAVRDLQSETILQLEQGHKQQMQPRLVTRLSSA